ncbi:MAG: hypothetical protein HY645_02770 [Acidobacteria bacterium]|nr:hypothetical protein [Acidobacteriota bacterium]
MKIQKVMQYFDFNVRHFTEKLQQEHGIDLSYTWIKNALQTAGLVAQSRKRGKHRNKRPRRPLPGMLLHVDGSRHAWLTRVQHDPHRGPGGCHQRGLLRPTCRRGEYSHRHGGLQRGGREARGFCSVYSDRGSHFFHTPKAGEGPSRQRHTQIGRAFEP